MNINDVTSRLIAHIADVCEIDPGLLNGATSVDSIGFDSLSLPRILHALEVEFVIRFDEDDLATIMGARTISAYIELIARTVNRSSEVPP